MYMYSRMYMKIEYLPAVVVQVVTDKVSWGSGCEERYKMYMYSRMHMKIEYLPAVIVQVGTDKVSWGM